MKALIHFRAFTFLFLILPVILVGQHQGFKSILEQAQKTEKSDTTQRINLLEATFSLQDVRYKDSVTLILNQLQPLETGTTAHRIAFLYHSILGRNQLFDHNYEQAIENTQRALNIDNQGTTSEIMYNYTTVGSTYYFMADYPKALEWHLKALQSCQSQKDTSCLAGIYNNLAVVYFGTGEVSKIEEYTRKAYTIADRTDNLMEKSRAAGNLAIVFAEQGNYDESEKWFLEDLEIDYTLKDTLSVARNYNNLGRLFEYKEDFSKALDYYSKGLEFATIAGDKASIALGYQNVGWIHHKTGRNDLAEKFFKQGMEQTRALGNKDKLRDAYFNISEYYSAIKKPEKALENYKKFHDLNDSIVGENHLNALRELEVKYETQQKENELLKLNKEKQENERVIVNQNRRLRQLSFGLGGIALFGVLGFLLFKQRLQNKKQEELLLTISETQTEERKRIAQDLHDSIGGSLALTKSKFEAVKNNLKTSMPEMETALQTLEQTTHQVRQISHNLMPGELVRFGLTAAINTLLENLNIQEINAQFHTNQSDERLEPLKEIQLYRIIQEALQNVLKHAQAKNLIIQLNKHKDHLSLLIEDDGNGIQKEEEEGIGLKNIRQRVQLLKGFFTIDSSPEKGTTLNIQIPL